LQIADWATKGIHFPKLFIGGGAMPEKKLVDPVILINTLKK